MGFTLATAAAAGLNAPAGIWVATLVLAGMCVVAAGLQHWREGKAESSLADKLAIQIKFGDTIFEKFREAGFSPFTTAAHEVVMHLSDDAMKWARGVEETLRDQAPEWHPEFSAAGGYIIPDEPDPEDITVEDMRTMLGVRLQLLAQIVQRLRYEERA